MTNRKSNPDISKQISSFQNSQSNSQEETGSGKEAETVLLQANLHSQVPISKWTVEKTLEWFNKKFPTQYDLYRESLLQNNVNGEILLDLNYNCLDQLNIFDFAFREQLMEEIALLKIRNEYEFIKRFKSQKQA